MGPIFEPQNNAKELAKKARGLVNGQRNRAEVEYARTLLSNAFDDGKGTKNNLDRARDRAIGNCVQWIDDIIETGRAMGVEAKRGR